MFEKARKQRRVLIFFIVTYIIFGTFFVYLLFMTPGLDFVPYNVQGEVNIYLTNDSMHLIRDIAVETSNGEKVLFVEKLSPGEKALLPMEGRTGIVELVAKAPFHATAIKSFSFGDVEPEKKIKLSYKITVPSMAFIDFNFDVSLELCNQGAALPELAVEESHSKLYFEEEKSIKTISLQVDECKTIIFTLTPKRIGQTKMYFNVKTLSYNEQIEKEIEIRE